MTRGLTELLPFKTILHPTDLSEHADNAYQLARLIARECGARLIVLHVVGMHVDLPQSIHTEMGLAFDCSGDYQRYDEALRDYLHERFEANPDVRVETRLIYGAAAAAILRIAEDAGCDLIVMGTHGRGGLGQLLMGSVAVSVLRKARCTFPTKNSPAVARITEPNTNNVEPSAACADTA